MAGLSLIHRAGCRLRLTFDTERCYTSLMLEKKLEGVGSERETVFLKTDLLGQIKQGRCRRRSCCLPKVA